MLSFIDGLLLRFRPFNAIAQIKRINRPSVISTNQHRSYCRLLAGGSGFDYMRDGQNKKETRMLRGSFFIHKHEYS